MTSNVDMRLLQQLNDTNDLLILFIEAHLATMPYDYTSTLLRQRLEQIEARRQEDKTGDAVLLKMTEVFEMASK